MADNFAVTAGTGTTIRAIEKSSIKAQVVTIDLGGAGAESLLTSSMPVKGLGFSVQVDFTVDAGAYGIGDALAAMGTFAGMASAAGKRAVISTITLTPNGAMPAIPFNLWLLNADLATPVAKNAAFVIVAADAPNILGIIPIGGGDYIPSQTSWNCATLRNVGLEYTTVATSVYAYLVTTAVTAPVATHVYLTLVGEMID